MTYSRYNARYVFVNNNEEYRKVFFTPRGVTKIAQYGIGRLNYPSEEELAGFENLSHIGRANDTLYNLAGSYYGDAKLWWVIAWFNAKPTESHFQAGDIVYIPMPLSKVMQYF